MKSLKKNSSFKFERDVVTFHIVGSNFQFKKASDFLKKLGKLHIGTPVVVRREPKNEHDKNACAVYFGRKRLGYVPRDQAAYISEKLSLDTNFQFFIFDFDLHNQGLYQIPILKVLGLRLAY